MRVRDPFRPPLLALLVALLLLAAGCDRSGPAGTVGSANGHTTIQVLAAENFWGSIAAQLGGEKVSVHSIIVNPAVDPHSYQPSAQDARAMAGAGMVIVNGVGYDAWAQQLLQASPLQGRVVLNVGRLLGLQAGANPHRWYFPGDVRTVARRMTLDFERLDPGDAAYFARRERRFETIALARDDALRHEIRARYTGVAVGYSESIFQGLGEDLGLRLLTPSGFVKAVAEGTDVTAEEKETVDSQARNHAIAVWVYNSQNVTPDVQRVNQIVREQRIPIATVTETLVPPSASFEQWQVAELEGLLRALHEATGR